MANIVANIAKGRVVEYYNRVKNNDPGTARLILVPIETSGLESDATLIDKDDLAASIVPLTQFDFAVTPDGTDIQMTTGVFFRAS